MKKLIPLLLALVLAMSLTATAMAATVYTEGALYYTMADESITITGYFGRDETVTIPASIAGVPVNTIAKGAFTGNSAVKTVDLPDTIMTVEEGAFAAGITVNYNSNIQQSDEPEPDDPKQDDPTKPSDPKQDDPTKPGEEKPSNPTKPGGSTGSGDTGSTTGNTGNTGTGGDANGPDSGAADGDAATDESTVDIDDLPASDDAAQPAPEKTGSPWGWVALGGGALAVALCVILAVQAGKKRR